MESANAPKTRGASLPRRVVVVGAGVAGLTAAHELAERGFEVEVIEPTYAEPLPWTINDEKSVDEILQAPPTECREPDSEPDPSAMSEILKRVVRIDRTRLEAVIGGMARSNWVAAPVPVSRDRHAWDARNEPGPGMRQMSADRLPRTVGIDLRTAPGDPDALRRHVTERLAPWARAVHAASDQVDALECEVQVQVLFTPSPQGDNPAALGTKAVKDALERLLRCVVGPDRIYVVGIEVPPERAGHVYVNLLHDTMPAEHGFRFFPAFYRHMFDTMKRIPIQVDVSGDSLVGATLVSDSHRTAFDNLVSAEAFEFALPRDPKTGRGRSYSVPRRRVRSIEEVRRLLAHVLEVVGYTGRDLAMLQLRYVQYLLSHPDRRRDVLETQSWSDFLRVDRFSKRFREHVLGAAQALTAMSSRRNDARTIGNIAMQLTLDQGRDDGHVDGTLNGPTTNALFFHWRRYLESQGVVFTVAELVGFEGSGLATRPVFAEAVDAHGTSQRGCVARSEQVVSGADYYVITIPVDAFQRLWDENGEPRYRFPKQDASQEPCAETPPISDAIVLLTRDELVRVNREWLGLPVRERDVVDGRKHLREYAADEQDAVSRYLAYEIGCPDAFEPVDPKRPPEEDVGVDLGPLRHMVGIQFFLESDVRVLKGHTMCQDSPWGVSYLSQAQYWQHHRRGYDGHRGVISAIFTRFNVPYEGRCAWQCSADEIARLVWQQIAECWDPANGPLPEPGFYFLDEGLEFLDEEPELGTSGVQHNRTPYLVNIVGDWAKRPGRRARDRHEYEYDLQLGHTVFAGVFMRTQTRLTTMESANESARRAVNAILAHEGMRHARCRTWNIEEHEPDDLRPLRDLDGSVHRRGLRHTLDNVLVEAGLSAAPWDLLRSGVKR